MRSVKGRAPENALVSHDLFEGVHGRTALASDIRLFEGFPPDYATYAMRLHRWVRGDWQLLPWLFPWVPRRKAPPEEQARAHRSMEDRRQPSSQPDEPVSPYAPRVRLGLVAGEVPSWTLAVLGILHAPMLPARRSQSNARRLSLKRSALAIAFLPHEASVAIDAIVRALVRSMITRKRLLQWTSAANAAFGIAAESPRAIVLADDARRRCSRSSIAALVAWQRPWSLIVALPLLAALALAPRLRAS